MPSLHEAILTWLRSYLSHAAGDYYTFGTICYTCLIIDVNYRATFLTYVARNWGAGVRDRERARTCAMTSFILATARTVLPVPELSFFRQGMQSRCGPKMFDVAAGQVSEGNPVLLQSRERRYDCNVRWKTFLTAMLSFILWHGCTDRGTVV